MTTIETGIEIFNIHLKSKDFFDTEQFPKANFVSVKITKIDDKNVIVYGILNPKEVFYNTKIGLKGVVCQDAATGYAVAALVGCKR